MNNKTPQQNPVLERVKSTMIHTWGGVEIRIYLLFLVIVVLGFWPVSTGLFSLKNDEIIYFLPYRYNIVENIRNGHFPLWSPYVYMGFPISGDMQSGAWNPLVWILALAGRYTLTTLHIELLIYIFFAAIGMFKLLQVLKFNTLICFTISLSFVFSGFIIDSGQFICWVSCACFLPYTYTYFIRMLKQPSADLSAKFALANFCLLIAGGYPFFFIANIYFFAIAFVVHIFVLKKRDEQGNALRAFKFLSLSVALLLLLSAAPVLNFLTLLPFYTRGTNLPLDAALYNSYSLFSSISFFFPFSITREHINFGNNNVLSRNLYVGILLLPFIITGIFTKRTIISNTIFLFVLLAFAISLGEVLPLRKWAYWWLPLMNTFRHPSNFRLFITVGLLLLAAKGLQHFFLPESTKEKQKLVYLHYFVLVCMIIIGIYFYPVNESNPFEHISLTPAGLKKSLNNISFNQAVFISLLIQLPFLITAIALVKKRQPVFFCMLSLVNLIVITQPQLLSSTVAKNPVYQINEYIKSQPQGFPIPSILSAVRYPDENKFFMYEYKEPLEYFFNKKIAINTYINNPTILKSYREFIEDSNLLHNLTYLPVVYHADTNFNPAKINALSGKQLSILSFGPNEIALQVIENRPGSLVILQNNFPGWKASINQQSVPIATVNRTFMGIKTPAGSYTIKLQYKPDWFFPGIIISLAGLLLTSYFLMKRPAKTVNQSSA